MANPLFDPYTTAYTEALGQDPFYGAGTSILGQDWSPFVGQGRAGQAQYGKELLQLGLSPTVWKTDPAAAQAYVNQGMKAINSSSKPDWKNQLVAGLVQQVVGQGLQGLGQYQTAKPFRQPYIDIISALGEEPTEDIAVRINTPSWTPLDEKVQFLQALEADQERQKLNEIGQREILDALGSGTIGMGDLDKIKLVKTPTGWGFESTGAAPGMGGMEDIPETLEAQQTRLARENLNKALGTTILSATPAEFIQNKLATLLPTARSKSERTKIMGQVQDLAKAQFGLDDAAMSKVMTELTSASSDMQNVVTQATTAYEGLKDIIGPWKGLGARTVANWSSDAKRKNAVLALDALAAAKVLTGRFPGAMSDADREFLTRAVPDVYTNPDAFALWVKTASSLADRVDDTIKSLNLYKQTLGTYSGSQSALLDLRRKFGGPEQFLAEGAPTMQSLLQEALSTGAITSLKSQETPQLPGTPAVPSSDRQSRAAQVDTMLAIIDRMENLQKGLR